MKRESFKVVELNGKRYQINQFTAMVGAWIVFKLGTKIMPIISALFAKKITAEDAALMLFGGELNSLSKNEFFDIQNEALSVVRELEYVGNVETAMPLRMADGRWTKPEIESDIILVMALTIHALVFNLSPLFDEESWKGVMASLPDFPSFDA